MPFKNRPLNGDKINYTWGDTPGGSPPGTPLVRVYPAANAELDDAEIVYDNMGPLVALNGPWRERFVIHSYDPDDADYFEIQHTVRGTVLGIEADAIVTTHFEWNEFRFEGF